MYPSATIFHEAMAEAEIRIRSGVSLSAVDVCLAYDYDTSFIAAKELIL
jgi:hypothetical protein